MALIRNGSMSEPMRAPTEFHHLRIAKRSMNSYGDATTSASSSSTRTVDDTECAYAPAKITGEPLLFKGDNFAQTDIKSAEQ